ncbi:hypothetical protein HYC85_007415 [Camellia sinensis]|uniref:Nuclear speckle splicing regulatory protein 1 N-terminal domain-containing protein n=1 Tax=Camellia sinensis TaxID=4442 RepID=A0A7J7HPH0_CAMSI|nr:hypothetical protein HYC85_007415 [Camellia sinensis]
MVIMEICVEFEKVVAEEEFDRRRRGEEGSIAAEDERRGSKQPARPPLPPPLGFCDEDEDDVKKEISRQASKNKALKDIEEQHKKALEEDPSMFGYDGVYDEMKEKVVDPLAHLSLMVNDGVCYSLFKLKCQQSNLCHHSTKLGLTLEPPKSFPTIEEFHYFFHNFLLLGLNFSDQGFGFWSSYEYRDELDSSLLLTSKFSAAVTAANVLLDADPVSMELSWPPEDPLGDRCDKFVTAVMDSTHAFKVY